jgi:hypothetical protein
MFKRYSKIIFIILILFLVGNILMVNKVGAQELGNDILENLQRASGGLTGTDPMSVIVLLVQGALGLLVIIFFIMIIVAGFRWMTAGGNEETVARAKRNIINAVIGAIVVIMAYAITTFVFNLVLGAGS